MKIDADYSDLTKISARLKDNAKFVKPLNPYFKQASMDFLLHVKAEAPFDKGNLQRWTDVNFKGALRAEIGTDDSAVPYAKFVYGGTKAFEIYPVNKKSLRFSIMGGFIFAKHIYRNAKSANPYIDRSWTKHKKEFIQTIEEGLANVIQEEVTP